MKAAQETSVWQKKAAREGLEGNAPALDTLRKNGMDVSVLSPAESAAFKAKTKSVHEKWAKEIGADLVKAAEDAVAKAGKK
jgi:TRAP-type transport system periplasmic protein